MGMPPRQGCIQWEGYEDFFPRRGGADVRTKSAARVTSNKIPRRVLRTGVRA